MNILVTGGAGYIGSHTCISLIEAGYSVIIADDLRNSKIEVINDIKKIVNKDVKFYEVDVTIEDALNKIFENNKIDGVIHFAGLKSVSESIKKPLDYYYNNVVSTINLLKACQEYNVNRFVFSSSATVYGENKVPFKESMQPMPPINPYGETKAISEKILIDASRANPDLNVSILRYFNPIGAHESGLIGEVPSGTPNNLMPYITQVAKGKLKSLNIFGNDYPTEDGTGIRDYIHVVDLAEGHVAALTNSKKGVNIYNLGTGKGTSVLQLIKTFEKVNGIKIPFKFIDRRPGDIAICYADISKAQKELNWSPKRNIKEMCRDAWNFEKNLS